MRPPSRWMSATVRVEEVAVELVHHDRGAVGRQAAAHRAADSSTTTGDDGHAVCEQHAADHSFVTPDSRRSTWDAWTTRS